MRFFISNSPSVGLGAETCASLFSLVTCLSVSGSVPPGLRVSAVALVMSGGRPPGDGASERSGRGSLFQSLLHGHQSLNAGITSAASESCVVIADEQVCHILTFA